MAPTAVSDGALHRPEEKHKRDVSAKKRAYEVDAVEGKRKHKRSKTADADADEPLHASEAALAEADHNTVAHGEAKEKKKNKHKSHKNTVLQDVAGSPSENKNGQDATTERKDKKKREKKKNLKEREADTHLEERDNEGAAAKDVEPSPKMMKKHHRHRKETDPAASVGENTGRKEKKKTKKKKEKKPKEQHDEVETAPSDALLPQEASSPQGDAEAMEVEEVTSRKHSKLYQPPDIPANPQFPFFTQTMSLYEPLYPVGWSEPVSSAQHQHLRHLQNSYVPSLRGVLLDYKNVTLGEEPGRAGAATSDEEPCRVISKNEYAVGYGWITADLELFVPSRGAWMEGSVNLQTEGHIGVVCFGRFNASIEAQRLPRDWSWVPNDSDNVFEDTASLVTADDHGVVRQVHSTGHWVDAQGDKIKGKIRFRIRNFDVGTTGEASYLSLEGTMLDRESEKKLVAEEAETAKARKEKRGGGALRRERRRAPEFSVTRFSTGEELQNENPDLNVDEKAAPMPNRMTTDD